MRYDSPNITFSLYPFTLWINFPRALKCFWQRRTRGFDDSTLWSLDWHLADFILPRLKAFKAKGKHGVPFAFLDPDTTEHSEEQLEAGATRFNEALDKMIYAFQCVIDPETDVPDLPDIKLTDSGVQWLGEDAEERLEAHRRASLDQDGRVKEGLLLFAEHFHSLYD